MAATRARAYQQANKQVAQLELEKPNGLLRQRQKSQELALRDEYVLGLLDHHNLGNLSQIQSELLNLKFRIRIPISI